MCLSGSCHCGVQDTFAFCEVRRPTRRGFQGDGSRFTSQTRQIETDSPAESRSSKAASPVASRQPRRRAWATMSRSKGSRVHPRSSASSNHAAAGGSSSNQRGSSARSATDRSRSRTRPRVVPFDPNHGVAIEQYHDRRRRGRNRTPRGVRSHVHSPRSTAGSRISITDDGAAATVEAESRE
jgi:hypothetical protein